MGTGTSLASPGLVRMLVAQVRLAVRLVRDPVVPAVTKAIPAAAVAYLIWPIDLLPDLFPILGQLDDVGIVLAGLQTFIHFCPEAATGFHRAALAAGRRYSPMPLQDGAVIDAEFRRE